jgi:hypothetical protein
VSLAGMELKKRRKKKRRRKKTGRERERTI